MHEFDFAQLYLHFSLGLLAGCLLGGVAAMATVAKSAFLAALGDNYHDTP